MLFRLLISVCFLLFICHPYTYGQRLKPGFDKEEYIDLLHVYSRQGDSSFYKQIPASTRFHEAYRSPILGLDNRWDLCVSDDNVAIISIRGTTGNMISWVENFYAAMVPASGKIKLEKDYTFDYHLSDNPRAGVHIGWLIATGFLARDICPKLDSCYRSGIKDVIILGHSQGGAISFLLTSYLHSLQKQGKLPGDIRFKTYCSAAPKPGNLYYAYEYERMTYGGWSFTVVNSADWVPETPVSVQMVSDNNTVNPFSDVKSMARKQKFPKNVGIRYLYNRLRKPSMKAHKRNQQYLGRMASKYVKAHLKEYEEPEYFPSSNYVRTGAVVVLLADSAYYKQFPDSKENVFVHHMLQPYLWLANKLPDSK